MHILARSRHGVNACEWNGEPGRTTFALLGGTVLRGAVTVD